MLRENVGANVGRPGGRDQYRIYTIEEEIPWKASKWCGRRESNPYGSLRGILSPLRLPVPPRPRGLFLTARTAFVN